MGRQVTIISDSPVALPNGRLYVNGETALLSDEQWGLVRASAIGTVLQDDGPADFGAAGTLNDFTDVTTAGANLGDVLSLTSDDPEEWGPLDVSVEIDAAVAALVDAAPGALDTLNELAAALGDDPNFAATVNASIAARLTEVEADALYRRLDTLIAIDQLTVAGGTAGDLLVVQAGGGITTKSATTVSVIEESTTARTFGLTDAGKIIECTHVDPTTVTVPDNATVAFPVGTIIGVYAHGAGGVTIAAAGGVTIQNLAAVSQYGEASLRKRATDEWVQA